MNFLCSNKPQAPSLNKPGRSRKLRPKTLDLRPHPNLQTWDLRPPKSRNWRPKTPPNLENEDLSQKFQLILQRLKHNERKRLVGMPALNYKTKTKLKLREHDVSRLTLQNIDRNDPRQEITKNFTKGIFENEPIEHVLLLLLCTFKDVFNKYIHDDYQELHTQVICNFPVKIKFWREIILPMTFVYICLRRRVIQVDLCVKDRISPGANKSS